MGVTGVPPAVHTAGVDWWNARFGAVYDGRVGFTSSFLPVLLKSCRLELAASDALSLDELRVVAKYCVADSAWQHDTISLTEFLHFLARFGPVEVSAQRLVESLTAHRELVTWFHGTITRAEAEQQLLAQPALEDGAFLVRFSESQPARLCLSYLKVHATGPYTGRREMRNVLIENIGQAGFVLTESRNKAYPSLRAFVQHSASRLKHGISSSLARRCNLELAAVRARQDLASNAYTTFSTDSLEPSSTSSPSSPSFRAQRSTASSLLFTKSPPAGPDLLLKFGNNQLEHLHPDDEEENYSGFTKTSLLPRPLTIKSTLSADPAVNGTSTSNGRTLLANGYGSFAAAAVVSAERSPPGSPARRAGKQIPFITPPAGCDYGDFSAFTSAVTSFSRVTPPTTAHNIASDSDYASFDTFVHTQVASATTTTTTAPTAVPSQDTYGAFEAFEFRAVPRPAAVAAPRALASAVPARSLANPPTDTNDDYGSFAALSLDSTSSGPPRPTVAVASSDSDVYGTFTLSPTLQPRTEDKDISVAALSLGSRPPVYSSAPPTTLPSDTYGSFESLLQPSDDTQSVDSAAPQSAPAVMTPLATAGTTDDDLESKVSALDELNEGMELYKKKQLDDALLRFIRAREAAQRATDLVVEARALGNLGTVYLEKQNPKQAVTCYEQSLEITRSVQDVKRERLILNNLVLALIAAEDFVSAYNYCQVQLEMSASEVNRRKIFSRMSELRERAARASRDARAANSALRPGRIATP